MKVPPNLIQAFISFCESKNIDEAARAIGITQPALSKQLKSFESFLPYKLFSFRGKKKILTPFGVNLYEDLAGKFHSIEKAIVSTCNKYGNPKNSVLKITARTEIIERIADSLEFEGKIEYFEHGHEKITSEILNGAIDIGITHATPDSSEVVAKKLFREKFRLLVPKYLNKKNINFELTPSISYKKNDPILRSFCSAMDIDFENLNIKRTCSNYMLIRDMVQSNIGWAVIPSYIKYDVSKCVAIDSSKRKIDQKEFYMFYRKENSQIPWFKEALKNIAKIF